MTTVLFYLPITPCPHAQYDTRMLTSLDPKVIIDMLCLPWTVKLRSNFNCSLIYECWLPLSKTIRTRYVFCGSSGLNIDACAVCRTVFISHSLEECVFFLLSKSLRCQQPMLQLLLSMDYWGVSLELAVLPHALSLA